MIRLYPKYIGKTPVISKCALRNSVVVLFNNEYKTLIMNYDKKNLIFDKKRGVFRQQTPMERLVLCQMMIGTTQCFELTEDEIIEHIIKEYI